MPSIINVGSRNKFRFLIDNNRFKDSPLELSVTEVNLPGLTIGLVQQPTPIKTLYRPGDSIDHNDINLSFMITEDLGAWMDIFNWIVDSKSTTTINMKEIFCDASLHILTNKFNKNIVVSLQNLFPYSLSDIIFTSQMQNEDTQIVTASFKYHDLKIDILD